MSSNKESERLQRLREQQLRDRDPGDGFRKTQRKLQSRPRTAFSLRDELAALPKRIVWMLWGALVGAILFGPLVAFGVSTTPLRGWVIWIYLAVVVWAMFLGFVFGNIRDKGSSDWDK